MNQRIRVLEVTKSTAGVAEYVRWLAQALDKSCFELTVACLSEGGSQFAAELSKIEGVRAFALEMNRYQMDPRTDWHVFRSLARKMRTEPFDLIHAHASKAGFLTRLAAWGTGLPVVYSPHCFSFHAGVQPWKAQVLAGVERWLAYKLTARFLVVADSEQTLARKYHVGRPEQFETVYTGIDARPFEKEVDRLAQKAALGLPADVRVVGSVGRLSAQKAPLDFINCAEQIARKFPDVHFVWIGDGPLLEEARALSQRLGLQERMHFAGQRRDVAACLAVMDCFLLTSCWEGFPIVALEAMAARVPVVATGIDGTREALESGVHGFLAPPGDCLALAQAVEAVLQDSLLAERLRMAGYRRVVEAFNQEQMIGRISQMYQRLVWGGQP